MSSHNTLLSFVGADLSCSWWM